MKLIHVLGFVASFASVSVIATPQFISSQKPIATSGVVSVAPQHYAKLNLVNIGAFGKGICNVTLSFFGNNNEPIGAPQDFAISGGQFAAIASPVTYSNIALMRAEIDFTNQVNLAAAGAARMAACARLIPTLEIIDSTGTKVIDNNFRFFGIRIVDKAVQNPANNKRHPM